MNLIRFTVAGTRISRTTYTLSRYGGSPKTRAIRRPRNRNAHVNRTPRRKGRTLGHTFAYFGVSSPISSTQPPSRASVTEPCLVLPTRVGHMIWSERAAVANCEMRAARGGCVLFGALTGGVFEYKDVLYYTEKCSTRIGYIKRIAR
ncbi:uncharacterized protein PV06_04877 [Exophiala oligosperma]|uniref:Uncharacterized protein n=1 Tax=Exophiala oligosperma TaxID=215243 RepID=A0A0D2DLE9_9EURO|nr:uncharacterized protein PV06_04877 [Exophiala oligosperma]KIW43813.1 hypothetical protein PV06_04877 [Exophiala oligosperma]